MCNDTPEGEQCAVQGQFVGPPRVSGLTQAWSAISDRHGTPTDRMDMQEASQLAYATPTIGACGARSAEHRAHTFSYSDAQA